MREPNLVEYKKLGGNSGIEAYRIEAGGIVVLFKTPTKTGECYYYYSVNSVGSSAVATMSSLAQAGQGLNSFISRNRPDYEDRW